MLRAYIGRETMVASRGGPDFRRVAMGGNKGAETECFLESFRKSSEGMA